MEMKEKNEQVEEKPQELSAVEGIPDFVKVDENETYHVTLKNGDVIKLSDITAKQQNRAEKMSMQKDGNLDSAKYQLMMLSEMSGIGELELEQMKASSYNRLKYVMIKVLDIEDFLSE